MTFGTCALSRRLSHHILQVMHVTSACLDDQTMVVLAPFVQVRCVMSNMQHISVVMFGRHCAIRTIFLKIRVKFRSSFKLSRFCFVQRRSLSCLTSAWCVDLNTYNCCCPSFPRSNHSDKRNTCHVGHTIVSAYYITKMFNMGNKK